MEREITRLDNSPPSDAAILQEQLFDETYEIRARFDELTEAFKRVPEDCTDDATATRVTDFINMIQSCGKSFEAKRVERKEPFLILERTVDGFFKRYTQDLSSMTSTLKRLLVNYQTRKEAEARRAAEEEARRKAEEAARKEAEAKELEQAGLKDLAEEALSEAVAADEESQRALAQADAKPSELARQRGSFGGVSSLKKQWTGSVVSKDELDLEKLRPYLALTDLEKAVKAYVRAGGRELRGAKIEEVASVMVR